MLGELKTNHQTQQRYELLAALGSTHDPKLADEVRNYGLTSNVAVGEIPYLYRSQIGEPENRVAFWQWLQAHFDALQARLPDEYQSLSIRIAVVGRCSKAQSDELQQWFEPRINSMIGGERSLAQSAESVGHCTSLREHVGEQALATWAEAHPPR